MDHNRNQTAHSIIAYLSSSMKTLQQISVCSGKLSYRKVSKYVADEYVCT